MPFALYAFDILGLLLLHRFFLPFFFVCLLAASVASALAEHTSIEKISKIKQKRREQKSP